jgi:arylsulfatase A
MQKLKDLNIDQNTVTFFTSDNGPWIEQVNFTNSNCRHINISKVENGGSAGLFRGGKGSTWEGGMREPAIVIRKKMRKMFELIFYLFR